MMSGIRMYLFPRGHPLPLNALIHALRPRTSSPLTPTHFGDTILYKMKYCGNATQKDYFLWLPLLCPPRPHLAQHI